MSLSISQENGSGTKIKTVFTIYTDHKAITYLFGENKGIPMTASARVTRWLCYEYLVQYKPGKELASADGLSRLPLLDVCQEDATPMELINLIEHLNFTPISVSEIIFGPHQLLQQILTTIFFCFESLSKSRKWQWEKDQDSAYRSQVVVKVTPPIYSL